MDTATTNALTTTSPNASLATVDLVRAAHDFAAGAKSPRTRDAYRKAWAGFVTWCDIAGRQSLPASAETVALYLTARATEGRKVATLEQSLAAISEAHRLAGYESPRRSAQVREVLKGIRRAVGVAPAQKAPVLVSELRAMVAALPESPVGVRDRALLLVGFAGAFRRSEVTALEVADVAFTADGLEIHLRRSKTDQEGAGRKVGLPYGSTAEACPVRALRSWLDLRGDGPGPVFQNFDRVGKGVGLTGRSVARIVQRAAKAAGIEKPERFAGHSLRAGLATAAAKAGKSERSIMKQTGHRSERMVRRYIRDASLFSDNAAAGLL